MRDKELERLYIWCFVGGLISGSFVAVLVHYGVI